MKIVYVCLFAFVLAVGIEAKTTIAGTPASLAQRHESGNRVSAFVEKNKAAICKDLHTANDVTKAQFKLLNDHYDLVHKHAAEHAAKAKHKVVSREQMVASNIMALRAKHCGEKKARKH